MLAIARAVRRVSVRLPRRHTVLADPVGKRVPGFTAAAKGMERSQQPGYCCQPGGAPCGQVERDLVAQVRVRGTEPFSGSDSVPECPECESDSDLPSCIAGEHAAASRRSVRDPSSGPHTPHTE